MPCSFVHTQELIVFLIEHAMTLFEHCYWPTWLVLLCACTVAFGLLKLEKFAVPYIRTMGYFVCGVPWCRFVPSKHLMVETKFAVWFETGTLHGLEILGCIYYASYTTWWRDVAAWSTDALVTMDMNNPEHLAERDGLAPLYIFYFGYAMFTFVRDLFLRQDRTGGNFTFTIHHCVTIFLTAVSYHYGQWRAGYLTRFLLGFGDVTLYFGKCYSAREQVGHGSRNLLGSIFLLNFLVWFCMRCCFYGYLCYSLTVMSTNNQQSWSTDVWYACYAMLSGCWVLVALQCLWTPFICTAGLRYFRTGDMTDGVHLELSVDEQEAKMSGEKLKGKEALDEKPLQKKMA